jgi:hypothetical protein
MTRPRWFIWGLRSLALAAGVAGSGPALCDPAPEPSSQIAQVDLQAPFATRSPWRLIVTQGPPAVDYGGNPAPGALHMCLEQRPAGTCMSDPLATPQAPGSDSSSNWEPHYLHLAKPVYPQARSAPPLLLLVTASMHAGNGGQLVVTQLLNYDRAKDSFERVYRHATGTNNNEEVRFIAEGALEGSVISADPTSDAPYGYWIVVSRFTPARTYRQVLRYRSATHYNDGNSLAVIDSEMPNIERRLGLWSPGSPLPLPTDKAKPCPRPHLKQTELWCE